jgi:hypothetical protein
MRGRRPKVENKLLEAIKFVSCAQRATGAIEATHCRLYNNQVIASNGILTACHPITEDIQVCPHTSTLLAALQNAPGHVNMTLTGETLTVHAEEFTAAVPCVPLTALPTLWGDPPTILTDNRLADAISAVSTLISDSAGKVVSSAFMLTPQGTAISSNGHVILEAWHGTVLPGQAVLPKALVIALKKTTGKTLYRLGGTETTLTLHYSDGAWVKCQTYPTSIDYPDFTKFLDLETCPVPVPANMFDVARRLQVFAGDGMLRFAADGTSYVYKLDTLETAAADKVENVPANIAFDIDSLLLIEKHCTSIHFNAAQRASLFFGLNVRGAISHG